MTTEQLLYAAVGALASVVAYLAREYIGYLHKDNTTWRNEMMAAIHDVSILFQAGGDERRREHEEILKAVRFKR